MIYIYIYIYIYTYIHIHTETRCAAEHVMCFAWFSILRLLSRKGICKVSSFPSSFKEKLRADFFSSVSILTVKHFTIRPNGLSRELTMVRNL